MSAITAGIIMGAASLVGSVFGGLGASSRARREAKRKAKLTGELTILENNRQAIINPYSGISDISSMAKNLSGMVSNPFASLGVATNAAEIQIEEADIALANTLDTLRSTGASAGGATALAQAALQSKKGVSANIEQQESANEKLRAQGEQALTQAKVSEQQRLQSVAISEGQRTQSADAQGKLFKFNAQEDRDNSDISYNIAKETGAAQRESASRSRRNAATAGIFTGVGQIAGSLATSMMPVPGK